MENCTIIYSCSEDSGAGSSPSFTAYPFTDNILKDKFISDWNNNHNHLEKHDTNPNTYFGSGDWIYWLEIREGYINIDLKPEKL